MRWEALEEAGVARPGVALGDLTTYKLGGPARWLVEVEDERTLSLLAEALAADPQPVLVVGRGSNLVVSDEGFPGVAVQLGSAFNRVEVLEDGTVRAGAATPLPMLARRAVREGRGGLEFFVGIPGSVGGAVRMNAGCYGSDTGEWLISARVADLTTGMAEDRAAATLGLGYRHSELEDRHLVLEASFRSKSVDPEEAAALMREVTAWRRESQPGGTLNAGSVFKNPPGDAAGRLIDALGLKGFRVGGASVSTKHANFFVAGEGASAQDVYDLVRAVQQRVWEEAGVRLEPEIRFAGRFET